MRLIDFVSLNSRLESNKEEGGRGVRYRGTSLIRNAPLLGPYRRALPRTLWWC